MNVDGSGQVPLTDADANDESPAWQPVPLADDPPVAPPATQPPAGDTTAPAISGLRASPPTFRTPSRRRGRGGTSLRYRLSEPARVRLTIERRTVGRRVGRACRRRSRANRSRRPCRLHLPVGGLAHSGGAGANALRFSGRLRRRALGSGSYRVSAIATDRAGNRSRQAQAGFRVVSRRSTNRTRTGKP